MARLTKDFTPDAGTLLKDAGAVTTSAAAQVGGEARVLDLGSSRIDARVMVDVTAMTVAETNQLYLIEFQVSNTADGAFTQVVQVGTIRLGHATATGAASGPNNAPGRFEIGVSNEVNGVVYRYARLYTRNAGSGTPSINYSAWLARDA